MSTYKTSSIELHQWIEDLRNEFKQILYMDDPRRMRTIARRALQITTKGTCNNCVNYFQPYPDLAFGSCQISKKDKQYNAICDIRKYEPRPIKTASK